MGCIIAMLCGDHDMLHEHICAAHLQGLAANNHICSMAITSE